MIIRIWTAEAVRAKAEDYRRHFETRVVPHLRAISGFKGASLLERDEGAQVAFIALTRWSSMQAIHGFAGPQPEQAIVEPEGRAALSRFDDVVRHYDAAVEEAAP